MIQKIEIRHGIQTPVFHPEPYFSPTRADHLREIAQKEALVRTALNDITRIHQQSRIRFDKAERLLRQRGASLFLSDLREIERSVREIAAKVAYARPAERRSMELPASTRAEGSGRIITFIASTAGLDRHGTKILPSGMDTSRYEANPIVLFGHDGYGGPFTTPAAENILGKTLKLRKSVLRLEADVEFLPASINPKAEMVLGMIKHGSVNAMSVGFIPCEIRTETDDTGREIPVIVRSELLELSVVPLPSNPEALVTGGRASKHDLAAVRSALRLIAARMKY